MIDRLDSPQKIGFRMASSSRDRVVAASILNCVPVRDKQGEEIGRVEDYLIDVDRGTLPYVVLSFGGFLGIGEKLFAVPWNVLVYDPAQKSWLLDVNKERLEEAPSFVHGSFPDFTDTKNTDALASFWEAHFGTGEGTAHA